MCVSEGVKIYSYRSLVNLIVFLNFCNNRKVKFGKVIVISFFFLFCFFFGNGLGLQNTSTFMCLYNLEKASNISSLKHHNQTNKYPFGLVDKYVLFLTSNVPKRGRYINAISVPVSFEKHRLCQFYNCYFFQHKQIIVLHVV